VLKACGASKLCYSQCVEDEGIRNGIKTYSNRPFPSQRHGEFVGGSDIIEAAHETHKDTDNFLVTV
jgi:monothiol glutaredoxin